ncbi:MAG: hypothetical protein ACOYYS_09995 [Chloroflexota bacterium]
MHAEEMANRIIKAQDSLVAASKRVASALDIHQDHVAALTPQTGSAQVRLLLTLEACARLISTVADVLDGGMAGAETGSKSKYLKRPRGEE